MTYSVQMLRKYPADLAGPADVIAAAIDACFDAAETCPACADACLAETAVAKLTACIRLNLDCADVCHTTGKLLARQTDINVDVVRAQVRACIAAVHACAEECRKHAAEHEHCRVCADACCLCEQACQDVLQGPPSASTS